MEAREQKGLEIAAKSRLTQDGNLWLVPSQSGRGKYHVNHEAKHCTCPDFETRQDFCKHLFAVSFTIQREYTDDGQTQTVTETVTIRKSYGQHWTAYNRAQTNEKDRFLVLLAELCKSIEEPIQAMGRPRFPLADMIFASTFKVYSTLSGRRFTSDLRDAHSKGLLTKAPHYNSISRYFENPTLTPFLKQLIEASAMPLQAIEKDFAVDSSGFSTCRFVQWTKAKYGDTRLQERHDWIKVHLMCGVRTNVVTSIEVTDRFGADCPQFKALVDTTAKNFDMSEVSADKAYLSAANLKTVVDHGAMPYIPFKSNSLSEWGARGPRDATNKRNHWKAKSELWRQMWHYYEYNQTWFMQQYHKRSNVESTFSMIKAKFGDRLRSKTKTAQINEALCKVLAHNLCCVIQSIYELGIDPTFWDEAA